MGLLQKDEPCVLIPVMFIRNDTKRRSVSVGGVKRRGAGEEGG